MICYDSLLQNATECYFKMISGFLLQNATTLLENTAVNLKYDVYYKLRQYTY